MSLKSNIQNKVTKRLFGLKRRDEKRRKFEKERQRQNAPHVVEYFHETSDPYSHLMVQVLPEFCRRFEIELKVNLVPPPPDWAAPERGHLETYARLDAGRLAARAGLDFSDPGQQPSKDNLRAADRALTAATDPAEFLQLATETGTQLWS